MKYNLLWMAIDSQLILRGNGPDPVSILFVRKNLMRYDFLSSLLTKHNDHTYLQPSNPTTHIVQCLPSQFYKFLGIGFQLWRD